MEKIMNELYYMVDEWAGQQCEDEPRRGISAKSPRRESAGAFHNGASDEARTRYLHLGKVALYQMSYTRNGQERF